MPFKPFDPSKKVHNHRLKLPHWRQWGTTYFITSRLADSLPTQVLDEWRALRDCWLAAQGIRSSQQLDQLPESQRHTYHREFTARFHELLDAGHGECVLAKADLAAILVRKLVAGHELAYHLDAWVIMPNHFHAIVEPIKEAVLGEIIHRWKGGQRSRDQPSVWSVRAALAARAVRSYCAQRGSIESLSSLYRAES